MPSALHCSAYRMIANGEKGHYARLKIWFPVDQGNVLISKCSLKAFPDWACTESPYFLIDVELESY